MSDNITPKEKILKKLRKSLLQKDIFFNSKLDFDTEVFVREDKPMLDCFKDNLTTAHGNFIYCLNTYHFLDRFLALAEDKGWQKISCVEERIKSSLQSCEMPFDLNPEAVFNADAGITGCNALIARTGSVLISSGENLSRTISIFPPVHIVVAYRDQLIYGLKEYFLKNDATSSSMWSIITGPSRTSDIERKLVIGAHGPEELYVFYIDIDK
jgi:L-lactate dehydrogenase complex protein LldG